MRYAKLAAIALVALIGIGVFAGCGSFVGENEESRSSKVNLVVVYGQHSNSAADPSSLDVYFKPALETEGTIGLIRLDGSPVKVNEGVFDLRKTEGKVALQSKNKKNRESEIASIANSMIEGLSDDCTVAQSPEVDILTAFELANKELSGKEGKNLVVISDPGFSTVGDVMNFTEIGLEEDAESYADYAVNEGLLPDLSSIDEIVWYCFGDVAAPQSKPKPGTIKNMKALWKAVLEASGFEGELRFEDAAPGAVTYPENLPSVSVIEVPEVSPYAGQEVELREDGGVHFNPDEDTFIDESAAEKTLAEYVEWLEDPTLQVHVRGYVAHAKSGHPEGELARLRAEAVKAKLVEMGVPSGQIIVEDTGKGLGPYDYEDEGGRSDSEIDALNRFVLLSFEQVQ